MFKKTIEYVDYNGTERKEDFYFNLTNAEVTEMQLSTNGGLDKYIENIVAAQDSKQIIELFKDLICKSYGEKSLDGKFFLKEDEDGHKLVNKFKATEAFSILYMELATNTEAATAFVNGITPKAPEDHKAPKAVPSNN